MQINSCISYNTALATLLKYTMLAVKCFRMSQGHKKCHMNSFLQSKIKLPNTAHGTMWVKEALENTISNKGKSCLIYTQGPSSQVMRIWLLSI